MRLDGLSDGGRTTALYGGLLRPQISRRDLHGSSDRQSDRWISHRQSHELEPEPGGVIVATKALWIAFAVFAGSLASPTLAASWQDAIAAVKANATAMSEKADALGYPAHIGTAYNEYRIREHSCAILGRMLGKASVTKHLEYDPPAVSKEGFEFRLEAVSLDNWVSAAEHILALSKERRTEVWNLDCAGQLNIPASEHIASNGPRAFYDIVGDGKVLRILGDVEEGFASSVAAALAANTGVEVVALGSAGGLVDEALRAGVEIRRLRLETTLWNNCYSACPLVFLAGTNRTIWSPYPELGFHQISRDGRAIPPDDPLYGLVGSYAFAMGTDGDTVLRLMMAAVPAKMELPDLQTLCDAKIALWVQRAC